MTMQDTIKEQDIKIIRYEKRLKDVVAAYKGVLREKNALQETLEALQSCSDSSTAAADNETMPGDYDDVDSNNTQNLNKVTNDKITKLSSSLATLMSEKSNMENKYLVDKRLIRKEFTSKLEDNESTIAKLKLNIERQGTKDKKYDVKLKELQERIVREQKNTSDSTKDQELMFKEVQDLLSAERIVRLQLEKQLEVNEYKMAAMEPDRTSLISSLERKLVDAGVKLEIAEKSLRNQQDIYNQTLFVTEQEYRQALNSEKTKVSQVRLEMNDMLGKHELLTSGLETKVNELTSAVADRAQFQINHQRAVEKLNEKISQLTDDNAHLSLRYHGDETESTRGELWEEGGATAEDLRAKILECSSKLSALGNEPDVLHANCTKSYQLLEKKLEQYKTKSNEMIRQLSNDDYDVNVELNKLKNELNNSIGQLEINRREDAIKHREEIDTLEAARLVEESKMKLKHCKELATLRQEMSSQRERTLNIIKEKENDLQVAKSSKGKPRYEHITKFVESPSFNLSLANSANNGDLPLMHYIEEIARLESECSSLRREKNEASRASRASVRESSVNESRLHAELSTLKSTIRDTLLSEKRTTDVNLDYVKNIAYAILMSTKPTSDRCGHLVSALATALHFSTDERDNVYKSHTANSTWWK